jgi:hypothetical protein
LYFTGFASPLKSARRFSSFYFANSSFPRTILFVAISAFVLAANAFAGPEKQRTSFLNSSDCKTAVAWSSAEPLLFPATLALSASIRRAASSGIHWALPTAGQSRPEAPDKPTNIGPSRPKMPVSEHRFWDRENDLLFAAVGASRALDCASTLNFRRRGRDEALLTDDIVDNRPAFAAIEATGTAASIGISYLFHHYHHHRLERWTSIVHASVATGGAIRNYSLKTAH